MKNDSKQLYNINLALNTSSPAFNLQAVQMCLCEQITASLQKQIQLVLCDSFGCYLVHIFCFVKEMLINKDLLKKIKLKNLTCRDRRGLYSGLKRFL